MRGIGAYPAFSGRDKLGVPGTAVSPRTVEHRRRALPGDRDRERGHAALLPPWFGDELVRRRVRESTVQTILGHATPATTRIYVHKVAVEVAEEYQDALARTARRAALSQRAKSKSQVPRRSPSPRSVRGEGGIRVFLGES